MASPLSTRAYGTRDCLVPSLVRKWRTKLKLLLSLLGMRQRDVFAESTTNCVRGSTGRTMSECEKIETSCQKKASGLGPSAETYPQDPAPATLGQVCLRKREWTNRALTRNQALHASPTRNIVTAGLVLARRHLDGFDCERARLPSHRKPPWLAWKGAGVARGDGRGDSGGPHRRRTNARVMRRKTRGHKMDASIGVSGSGPATTRRRTGA